MLINDNNFIANNINNINDMIENNNHENNNNNYIKLMNITESKNFYSNNSNNSKKSKLYTYKKIKIPKLSKHSVLSGRNESTESNKKNNKSSSLSFNKTYDNFNKIKNFSKKEKKRNNLNSIRYNNEKNKDEIEIFFKKPIIEHVYDRNITNNNINNDEKQILTDRNIKKHNNTNIIDINKEKDMFSNKFNTIYKKINLDKKQKINKLVNTNNNININQNSKLNTLSINPNLSNRIFKNKNNSSIYTKNKTIQIKDNKDLIISPIIQNSYLFQQPKLYINQNNLINFNKIGNKYIVTKIKEKHNLKFVNKEDIKINVKNNILIDKSINISNKNTYIPFDLLSLVFYGKENEIKESLIKELNNKRVKHSEKKNKIICFKK